MGSEIELHQATYSFLRTQIEFGFYRPGDTLPAMEELCRQAHISLDTVKLAYQRLQDEGYISLLPKAGARVIVKYDAKEVDRHIQVYFAQRKTALLDLSQALPPLLSWAQWLSLKHSPAEMCIRDRPNIALTVEAKLHYKEFWDIVLLK